MLRRSGWRWAVAAVLIAALALGLGVVLRDAGLGAAANVAQLVSLAPVVAALVGWARVRRSAQQVAGEVPATLGELLRTIADANGLTGQDLRARLHGWDEEVVDAYLSGDHRPRWDFVVAFIDVIAADDRLRRELVERRIRAVWVAGAEAQMSGAGSTGSDRDDGIAIPEIRDWMTVLRRVADARRAVARIQESISRNEVLRTVLAEMLARLSQAVTLLTAERDDQSQDLAARHRGSGAGESRRQSGIGSDSLRGSVQDIEHRLSEAERLEAATARRLEESERQRRLAEKIRDEAIAQAERTARQLAEVEHRPASGILREAVIPQIAGDQADALMGDTDRGIAAEVLHRADQVLQNEAAALGQLDEELTSAPNRPAIPRLAIVMAGSAVVIIIISILVGAYVAGGSSSSYPGSGSGGRVRYLTLLIDSPIRYTPISWDFGKGLRLSGTTYTAHYVAAKATNKPELVFFGEYSVNISPEDAGQNACRSAILRNPDSSPVTNLHKGLIFCVQAVLGIALVEVTQNLDESRVLHLRETYWPTSNH